MRRHAYMIMAHTEFQLLHLLIGLLDDERNDIYVHVDRNAVEFDPVGLTECASSATLSVTDRIAVHWGGPSQIEAELLLLGEATATPHRYYHLISGTDLPLVRQDAIHAFFAQHDGHEFVHFGKSSDQSFLRRFTRRHLFTEHQRTSFPLPVRFVTRKMDGVYGAVQDLLRVGPFARTGVVPKKGSQWFSITHELACHVVDQQHWIMGRYAKSVCGDESFLQTLVYYSKYRSNIFADRFDDDYRACLRKISWGRIGSEEWQGGSPRTWCVEDNDELIRARSDGFLFARKFSLETEPEIVANVIAHIREDIT